MDPTDDVLTRLRGLADPGRLDGMARYGIATERALGVTVTELRGIARGLGRNHDLALTLWRTEIHEARILASMVDEPTRVTRAQMDAWVEAFDSWDLCDQVCGNLFDRTPHAFSQAERWSGREREFVRRAAFSTMATAAVHRKDVGDEPFQRFLPIAVRASTDERTYVKKAVNWAIRQIGKRNAHLHGLAVATAEEIRRIDARAARWIATDALRELRSPAVLERLGISAAASEGP